MILPLLSEREKTGNIKIPKRDANFPSTQLYLLQRRKITILRTTLKPGNRQLLQAMTSKLATTGLTSSSISLKKAWEGF